MSKATDQAWVTEGFDAFRRGTFGNGGHNLYVSRAGVLQRIHQFDLDGDGFVDLVFSNSHDYWETAPPAIYRWHDEAFERRDVPAPGGRCAVIADLTGDEIADLVVGRQFDGVGFDVNAIVLYGTDRGWGEHAVQYLPAPDCRAVAAGDFDGDGRPDLAFMLGSGLRVFRQTDFAFEPKGFVDLPIRGTDVAAADLDGDGCHELVVRSGAEVRIYWGGPGGLSAERSTVVPWTADGTAARETGSFDVQAAEAYSEIAGPPAPQLLVVGIGGRAHLFLAGPESFALLPVESGPAVRFAPRIRDPRSPRGGGCRPRRRRVRGARGGDRRERGPGHVGWTGRSRCLECRAPRGAAGRARVRRRGRRPRWRRPPGDRAGRLP